MVNRRFFLLCLSSVGLVASLPISFEKPYRMIFKLIPKNPSEVQFESARDFFAFYGRDNDAGNLNRLFLEKGWISDISAEVNADGNSVTVTKVYQSLLHKKLYSKLWNSSSNQSLVESKIYHQIKLT